MRLFEHPDFAQAILRAEEHLRAVGLRPAIIETDSHDDAWRRPSNYLKVCAHVSER
jgi:hypothetical protein